MCVGDVGVEVFVVENVEGCIEVWYEVVCVDGGDVVGGFGVDLFEMCFEVEVEVFDLLVVVDVE